MSQMTFLSVNLFPLRKPFDLTLLTDWAAYKFLASSLFMFIFQLIIVRRVLIKVWFPLSTPSSRDSKLWALDHGYRHVVSKDVVCVLLLYKGQFDNLTSVTSHCYKYCFIAIAAYHKNRVSHSCQELWPCKSLTRLQPISPNTLCFLLYRSIGVLTYVMLTGVSPFLGEEKQETYLNISQGNVDYSQDVFHGITNLAVDFIQSLLHLDPRYAEKGQLLRF